MSVEQLQQLYRRQTADPFEPRACPRAGGGDATSPNTSEVPRGLAFLSPIRWGPPIGERRSAKVDEHRRGLSKPGKARVDPHSGMEGQAMAREGNFPRGHPLGRVACHKLRGTGSAKLAG
eukprot:10573888-Alexandrium_andersonii.AAC.1